MRRGSNSLSSARAASAPRNRLPGNVAAISLATVAGVLRAGGGKRVRTENVSKAACPARPSRRPSSASCVWSWWRWSLTTSATATLVSTSSGGEALRPVGISQRAHRLVVDVRADGRDHEAATALHERLPGDRLHADARALGDYLHLAGSQ